MRCPKGLCTQPSREARVWWVMVQWRVGGCNLPADEPPGVPASAGPWCSILPCPHHPWLREACPPWCGALLNLRPPSIFHNRTVLRLC